MISRVTIILSIIGIFIVMSLQINVLHNKIDMLIDLNEVNMIEYCVDINE